MSDALSRIQAALTDHYRIERELGRGGMAIVYLAHDLRHDRPVALKVLHPELAETIGTERFLREIKLAARLQHPHIISVHDSGDAGTRGRGSQLWFTMPYIDGESLRERLHREHQLPVDEAVRITREVALALDAVVIGKSSLEATQCVRQNGPGERLHSYFTASGVLLPVSRE